MNRKITVDLNIEMGIQYGSYNMSHIIWDSSIWDRTNQSCRKNLRIFTLPRWLAVVSTVEIYGHKIFGALRNRQNLGRFFVFKNYLTSQAHVFENSVKIRIGENVDRVL